MSQNETLLYLLLHLTFLYLTNIHLHMGPLYYKLHSHTTHIQISKLNSLLKQSLPNSCATNNACYKINVNMFCLNTILFLQIKIQNNYKSQLARLSSSG